jgi:hypothetical protein
MDTYLLFPDRPLNKAGSISAAFENVGINGFLDACFYVSQLPYGYNSDRDDAMILFKEKKGTCTTKHAVIATLAQELSIPVHKRVGIYAMTEDIVTGTNQILTKFGLPYVPMVHCFLAYEGYRVDLTADNHNGKNKPIENFLHMEAVAPDITAKAEYLLYRKALETDILKRPELQGANMKTVLKARVEGLELLKRNVETKEAM